MSTLGLVSQRNNNNMEIGITSEIQLESAKAQELATSLTKKLMKKLQTIGNFFCCCCLFVCLGKDSALKAN